MRQASTNPARGLGFNLVELLVVMALIAILAALLLPAGPKAKARAMAANCLGNTRQLQVAWLLYASDNNDSLVGNPGLVPDPYTWIDHGWVDLDDGYANYMGNNGGCTNELTLSQGALWSYVLSEGVFRCPDQHQVYASDWNGTVTNLEPARSYSVSMRMNSGWPGAYARLSQVLNPDPSMAFVFIDENLFTISDGRFFVNTQAVNLWGTSVPMEWADVPAARHGGTGTLSFADGHSELHLWVEPSTPLLNGAMWTAPQVPGVNGGPNQDIWWLQARYASAAAGP
jgi:prepilin-type N-terminal cleavage/methylation domain-containing protein/prepilin-type processing-associated H-X9-DG protein